MLHVGIIPISDVARNLSDSGSFRTWLPPEHHVLGVRHDHAAGMVEFLVEGPWLPAVEELRDAARVLLLAKITHNARLKTNTVTAWFECSPDHTWVVVPKPR